MKKIITFGTFDLFHIGHLNLISRAAKLGDSLTVGVSSDTMNYEKKGFYPLFPLQDRMAIISGLRVVDAVFVEESMDFKRDYILAHLSDILVMGADWIGKFDEFRDICEVIYLPRTEDISTTLLKERITYPI